MEDADTLSKDTSELKIYDVRDAGSVGKKAFGRGGSTRGRISSTASENITQAFRVAAAALRTGELVKDEGFTLFEAVGALEIMDSKMDSGYLVEGDSLDDDYEMLDTLAPEEVLGIMDQMLCFEMAWHMGYPLSQSIFTSLHIDRLLWPEPKTLEEARFDRTNILNNQKGLADQVLRPFCLGLIKTCDFVYKTISAEHYYEEEDFVLSLYNRSLLSGFSVDEIIEILEKAKTCLSISPLKPRNPLRRAIATRLELRINLLKATSMDGIVNRQRADHWQKCIELLPSLLDSTAFGKPVQEAFSSKVQRRLASTVPPRAIAKVDFKDAVDLLGRLCKSAKDAYGILSYYGGAQLQNFVCSFQSQIPQPPTYVRSLMQSLIFSDMKVLGGMSLKQVVFDELEEIVLPTSVLLDDANSRVEAPQDPRFQIARLMDDFITKTADAYIDIYRTLCMNRSRLRRMLCHLVQDWDNIQYDAEALDTSLRAYTHEPGIGEPGSAPLYSFPLSSWCYYQKLLQMSWIVQLGFELDVYTVPELGSMYMYLVHLSTTLLNHLDRIQTFMSRRLPSAPTRSLTAAQAKSFGRSFDFTDLAKSHTSAKRTFACALAYIYAALSILGLIAAPYHGGPYSSPNLRYILRVRPFLSISIPDVPTFEDIMAATGALPSVDGDIMAQQKDPSSSSPSLTSTRLPRSPLERAFDLLNRAESDIKSARIEWDALGKLPADKARCQGCEVWWRGGIKDVIRSCIKAGIGVATVRKVVEKAEDVEEVQSKIKVLIDVGGGVADDIGKERGKEASINDKKKKKRNADDEGNRKQHSNPDEPARERVKGKGRGYHEWWLVPDISLR